MLFLFKLLLITIFVNKFIVCETEEHTIELTKENFELETKETNFFVMFFAPWCGHCQKLHPTWEQLAEMLNEAEGTRVKIGKVDCTTNNDLCSQHEVTGYPTLKFFKKGDEESVKFRGTRDLNSLSTFINDILGDSDSNDETDDDNEVDDIPKPVHSLNELTDITFNEHVEHGKHFVKFYAPWCGHCQRLAPTWEELAKSVEHDTTVSISKIDCTQYRPICLEYEVKGYPTLLWIEDGKKIEKYSGARSHEELKAYVEKMAGTKIVGEGVEVEGRKMEGDSSPVLQLTGADFDHVIEKSITFVKFFAPWCGHCKRLIPAWEELSIKFINDPTVKIAKVDCTLADNKELCSKQEVDGFPTMFIYKNGEKISEYNGSRTLEDLYNFIKKYSGHDELNTDKGQTKPITKTTSQETITTRHGIDDL